MNTQPGSLRVFWRIDCSCASASSSRSSRGLMVTTREKGFVLAVLVSHEPSFHRWPFADPYRPATGTWIESCKISMNASEFLL